MSPSTQFAPLRTEIASHLPLLEQRARRRELDALIREALALGPASPLGFLQLATSYELRSSARRERSLAFQTAYARAASAAERSAVIEAALREEGAPPRAFRAVRRGWLDVDAMAERAELELHDLEVRRALALRAAVALCNKGTELSVVRAVLVVILDLLLGQPSPICAVAGAEALTELLPRMPARAVVLRASDGSEGLAKALQLTPDVVLDALASVGLYGDGRLMALSSYENRVYQARLDDGSSVVAKFYRPGRWSDEQILEEHAFAAELMAAEIPVIGPLQLTSQLAAEGPHTLHHFGDFGFSVSPRRGGRPPELDDGEVLEWIGRFLARIHTVGARRPFEHRGAVDIATFAQEPMDWLLAHQNSDGGWGEDAVSYRLDYHGYERSPSTSSQTAWALLALMAVGEVENPAVIRGVEYLKSTQTEKGLWDEQRYTATGFPRVLYLRYHGYSKFFPLWALARYRNLKSTNSRVVGVGM